ncbi:MAG TPA: DUF1413 domain-containing protein [Negativicutes bacterium]|jgi:hypothetical protein
MTLQDHEHDLYKKVLSGISQRRQNKDCSEFSIPDLFSVSEWAVVPNPSRLKIGKLFKLKVDDNFIPNVVFCHIEKKWAVYKVVF